MSKKKGKAKGKKGDEELEEEIRRYLQIDIEILENNIHLEKMREVQAIEDLKNMQTETENIQKLITKKKNDEAKFLSMKSDELRQEEQNNANSIKVLEVEIKKLDIDIDDLEKLIVEKAKLFQKEEEAKDLAIEQQKDLFNQMTVRFQHILENTANKLQERVKMGS